MPQTRARKRKASVGSETSSNQTEQCQQVVKENTVKDKPQQCSFGSFMDSDCHRNLKPEIKLLSNLSDTEQTVLKMRAEIPTYDISVTNICRYHELHFGEYFERRQTKCCNILDRHVYSGTTARKVNGQHSISLEMAINLQNQNLNVIPGWKLCRNCYSEILSSIKTDSSDCLTEDSEGDIEYANITSTEEKRAVVNERLGAFGISPVKTHGKSKKSQAASAMKKIQQSVEIQLEDVAEILQSPELRSPDISSSKDLQDKASDFDSLLEMMKDKLSSNIKTREQIQLMTIAPCSWSRKKISEYFNVSEYVVREARSLVEQHGILAIPDKKQGHSLPDEVVQSVRLFYEDDEFSRQMPGGKDFVSIGKKIHVQKRLLLCNLKELYVAYKDKYPMHKIGLSKFCELRPKWCVPVSSSGSHSVCVCTHHQNTKLMVDGFCSAVNTHLKRRAKESEDSTPVTLYSVTYKDLMEKVVCDTTSLECMVHRCENCPGFEALEEYVTTKMNELEIDEEIRYSQWESVDRTMLQRHSTPVEDFIELLVYSIDNLTTHSFIAKSQAQYLKKRKEELGESECIILLDFAENYSFVVQDAIQGYHWNKDQFTLHPCVIYYRRHNELQHISLCIISDDLNHDVPFVYELLRLVTNLIKENLPETKQIEYFNDGCAGHYKTYKNFLNLCHHKSDFNIDAFWSFFATSHGKSPCDGIGGTVKRTILRASLQRPIDNQILTFEAAKFFCQNEISEKITFIVIEKGDMVAVREMQNARFRLGQTVPGTRSCHYFRPTSQYTIEAKQLSTDNNILIHHSFKAMPEPSCEPQQNDYVTCLFDGFWWLALVKSVNCEEKDLTCNFMHPHGPSNKFHWPQSDDCAYVPFSKVIMKVSTPKSSNNGRQYFLQKDEIEKTQNFFKTLTSK